MKATATATRRSARAKAAGKKAKISTAPAAVAAAPTRHIDWRGKRITLFESRVYEIISTIPKGKVSTYAEVARALHSGPRPVGQALKKNPFAPEVPCHRVVAATLDIGGFMGSTGEDSPNICKKRRMLTEEGVDFTPDMKVASTCFYRFDEDSKQAKTQKANAKD